MQFLLTLATVSGLLDGDVGMFLLARMLVSLVVSGLGLFATLEKRIVHFTDERSVSPKASLLAVRFIDRPGEHISFLFPARSLTFIRRGFDRPAAFATLPTIADITDGCPVSRSQLSSSIDLRISSIDLSCFVDEQPTPVVILSVSALSIVCVDVSSLPENSKRFDVVFTESRVFFLLEVVERRSTVLRESMLHLDATLPVSLESVCWKSFRLHDSDLDLMAIRLISIESLAFSNFSCLRVSCVSACLPLAAAIALLDTVVALLAHVLLAKRFTFGGSSAFGEIVFESALRPMLPPDFLRISFGIDSTLRSNVPRIDSASVPIESKRLRADSTESVLS